MCRIKTVHTAGKNLLLYEVPCVRARLRGHVRAGMWGEDSCEISQRPRTAQVWGEASYVDTRVMEVYSLTNVLFDNYTRYYD